MAKTDGNPDRIFFRALVGLLAAVIAAGVIGLWFAVDSLFADRPGEPPVATGSVVLLAVVMACTALGALRLVLALGPRAFPQRQTVPRWIVQVFLIGLLLAAVGLTALLGRPSFLLSGVGVVIILRFVNDAMDNQRRRA